MANNFIDLQAAVALTKRYRENKDQMVTPDYAGSLHIAETFDATAIKAILDQPGCVEFRAYFGMKEDKKICFVFVGVNEHGEDLVGGTSDVIVEYGRECPPYCTTSSPLNG